MTEPKKKKMQVATVEVFGLGKGSNIRLTEAGAEPLGNGAKVKLPYDAAQRLTITHGSHVRFVDDPGNHHAEVEAVEMPADWRYEILSGKVTSPVDTAPKKEAPKEPAKVGKPANRSMQGKVEAKA